MKKIATFMLTRVAVAFTACANDKPISYEQLPSEVKTFITAEFPALSISHITMDPGLVDTSYDVYFTDGLKIEFNGKGEWEEMSSKNTTIPVKFIPEPIKSTVDRRWPNVDYRKIEKHRFGYEVELTNRLELKFDKNFNLKEIDD